MHMKSEAQEWQKLTKLYQVGYYELLTART